MTESFISRPLNEQKWTEETNPLLSVIVLAYNQEKFIVECLESVLKQVTNFGVEIIIHDDASTDSTPDIVRGYAKKFPHIVVPVFQTENQLSQLRKVRTSLLQKAKGEFIAFCDGDDFWVDPYKLTKQVGFLRQNPEYVLSYHNAAHVDEAGSVIQEHHLPARVRRDYSQSELRELKWGWMLFGTILHRNVKIDFPPEYHLVPNGDNFYPMLLAAHGGAKFQEEIEPLAYRQLPMSVWALKTPAEQAQMHLRSYLQIAAYFVRIGEEQTAINIITGKLSNIASQYMAHQHTDRPNQPVKYKFTM